MNDAGDPRTVAAGLDILQPWFWGALRMPARDVEALTPRQADRYIRHVLTRASA